MCAREIDGFVDDGLGAVCVVCCGEEGGEAGRRGDVFIDVLRALVFVEGEEALVGLCVVWADLCRFLVGFGGFGGLAFLWWARPRKRFLVYPVSGCN